jgi:3-hydroxyisobutyrate dehydrogenase
MSGTATVAVLGTGIMGAPMARNLARAGLGVRVWNRTRAKAEPLAADGARVAQSPAEAVDGADVVLTILHDGPATLDVMEQASGAISPGAVWAQCSTAGIGALRELARFAHEHGLVFVDSPVLGTRKPAEDGQLLVLAAGPEAARPVLRPVFDAVGQRTEWVGDDGTDAAATRLKLVCNSWVLAVTHGTAEALALARALGVDPQAFLGAVSGGALDMGYLRAKASVIIDGGYTPPSFAVVTAQKDAELIVAAAEEAGVRLDVAAAGVERFRRAAQGGHGDEDMAASYFASFDD